MSANQLPGPSSGCVQEYVVRVPKVKEKFNIMKFNASLKVDVAKWEEADMTRENNLKEYKPDEEMPKYGAGSEYGRELKEEARRKKYGIITKRYNPADQPWILSVGVKGEKSKKRYKGLREGGITENASYFIFVPSNDGAFDAYPVSEWYNFAPMVNYRYLNAEEAEEEFGRRDKVLNYFSIMLKKRLKPEDDHHDEGEEGEKKKKGKSKKKSDLLITEDEEWVESSEEDGEESGEEKDKKKEKPTKPVKKEKKKKKHSSDDEAEEDSDDGDDEGREVDYMSDSSSSGSEHPEEKAKNDLKGVEDEPALRKLDQSDSEEEEGEEKQRNENENNEESNKPSKEEKTVVKKEDVSSESSSDSDDSDDFDNDNSFQSAMFMQQSKNSKKHSAKKNSANNSGNNSAASSRATTPTQTPKEAGSTLNQAAKKLNDTRTVKRKLAPEALPSVKKPRIGPSPIPSTSTVSQSSNSSNNDSITEDAVRRYLLRKPMTTTELLQKFKSKKTGLTSDQMVTTLAQILKKINPEKSMVKGKMYLSMRRSE